MGEHLPLAPAMESPRIARQFVAERLGQWGYASIADDVQLLTSEVVSNAVLHARAPLVVELEDLGDGVLVAVRDPVPEAPKPRDAGPLDTNGRGLAIVAALASAWGVAEMPGDGKSVWFKVASPT